jgi:3-phenylpropionate/trans-cinnamate dioxygenase ferredoxin reductase subunit
VAERRPIVVVGGGVAAQRCAAGLRERGYDGPLVMVCGESELPYDRTLLSKDALTEPDPAPAPLQPSARYDELGIEVLAGTMATGLDVHARRISLSPGRELAYSQLVVCSGGRPRLPAALDCPGVLLLRELEDALALRDALERCSRLAVVGGGFIGAEVACAAAARGLDVTLVEALEQPLAGVLGPEVGARVAALHRANGVRVLAGVAVAAIRRRAGASELTLADGRSVHADTVVVGAGMAPATGWLEDTPLRLDDGIVTDSACRTGVPGVLAAGDCARWWHPGYRESIRVEHWDTAARHGAAAAAAALGDDRPFAPLPFFWSDQHGVKLQWLGYARSWDSVEIEDLDPPRRFSARYHRGGRLAAVLAAGQPRVLAAARRELQQPVSEQAAR